MPAMLQMGISDNVRTNCVPPNTSLGDGDLCQLEAFSRVGAIVASFVPTECPVGGGMWGIFRKARKGTFLGMHGLGGVGNHIFPKIDNWR